MPSILIFTFLLTVLQWEPVDINNCNSNLFMLHSWHNNATFAHTEISKVASQCAASLTKMFNNCGIFYKIYCNFEQLHSQLLPTTA